MTTYTITQEQLNKLNRMITFAEYWLEDRESGDEQWVLDHQDVNEAIAVINEINED